MKNPVRRVNPVKWSSARTPAGALAAGSRQGFSIRRLSLLDAANGCGIVFGWRVHCSRNINHQTRRIFITSQSPRTNNGTNLEARWPSARGEELVVKRRELVELVVMKHRELESVNKRALLWPTSYPDPQQDPTYRIRLQVGQDAPRSSGWPALAGAAH